MVIRDAFDRQACRGSWGRALLRRPGRRWGEDYYGSEGEAPGRWVGAGSVELGLDGRVGSDEILRLLAGQDPASGRALGRELKAGDVAGFDLTFRSPKRVSILFGVGDPALATAIRAGHDTAVSAALAYLEREACVVRRGRGGAVELQGRGFLAAAFEHRSSRAGDPTSAHPRRGRQRRPRAVA